MWTSIESLAVFGWGKLEAVRAHLHSVLPEPLIGDIHPGFAIELAIHRNAHSFAETSW